MTFEDVKRNIFRNTVSNYICIGLRVVLGIVMFRLFYQELTREEFGFWALLWSVFGYGVLLDFGFGFTAQKRVAELSVHQKWDELSRTISTIFFCYVGLGIAIVLAGVLSSGLLIDFFRISSENKDYFYRVLLTFLVGMGIAFPMGIFPEMLRGLQRINLVNNLLVTGMVANFALSAMALYTGCGLRMLVAIAILCTVVPDLICGWLALKHLPQVRISWRFFSREMVRETMSFSIFAYVITVSNIILTRTDHLVLSSLLTVSAVAIYQAGAKVADVFFSLTQQMPDTLSPAAAHLHAKGDRRVLQELMIRATRVNVMIATPLYCLCALFMEGILRVLTGEVHPDPEAVQVAEILLLWIYVLVVTQGVSKRIFIMCGHERRLMWMSVGEALLNLGLSVGLVLHFQNVACVAFGSLIASFVFGWFYLWPWAAREVNMTGLQLARTVFVRTWLACIPLFVFVYFQRAIPALDFRNNLFLFAVEGMLAFAVATFGVWRLALTGGERQRLNALACRFFARS